MGSACLNILFSDPNTAADFHTTESFRSSDRHIGVLEIYRVFSIRDYEITRRDLDILSWWMLGELSKLGCLASSSRPWR